jgi:hypothetical protein
MGNSQDARRRLDAGANLGTLHPLAFERKTDIRAHRHVRIEREQLKDEGDVALRRALEGNVLVAEHDAARGRQLEPGDHPQRRRLAAARGPEQAEELAIRDGKTGIANCDEIAERLVQSLDPELGHRAPPQSGNLLTTMNITVPMRMVTKE